MKQSLLLTLFLALTLNLYAQDNKVKKEKPPKEKKEKPPKEKKDKKEKNPKEKKKKDKGTVVKGKEKSNQANLKRSPKNINKDDSKALKAAKRHIYRFHYYQALPYLHEALNANISNAEVLFLLGKCYFETENYDEAYKYLDLAELSKASPHADFPYYGARMFHYANQFERAIPWYEKAVQKMTKGTNEHKELANMLEQARTGLEMTAQKPIPALVKNMGTYVNTKYSEYVPNFNKKFNSMLFTSRRPRKINPKWNGNYYNEELREDVYSAKMINGAWQKVNLGEKNLPTGHHEANILASPDHTEMYLFRSKKGGDLYYSKYTNEEWAKPKSLGPIINTKYFEPSFCLSPDKKLAFFSSNKPGGKGKLDIYVAKMTGEHQFSNPVNLSLNSQFDDDAPYFDGKYLYFASNRPQSIGGFDIFKCEMINDTTFSEPENMGMPVNSGYHDIFYFYNPDSNYSFLSSWRTNGFGRMDNYIVDFNVPAPIDTQDVAIVKEDTVKNDVPEIGGNKAIITGSILDGVNDSPIPAKIQLIELATNKVLKTITSDGTNGKFTFDVESGKKYRVNVESTGYLRYFEDIYIPIDPNVTVYNKIFGLQKYDLGNKIVLGWQFFDTDSYTLKKESVAELEQLSAVLSENPEIKIKIIGHTDNDGARQYNQNLSVQRAKIVQNYLFDRGIATGRVLVDGKGEDEPLYDNNSKFKKWNRRVEIYIIE